MASPVDRLVAKWGELQATYVADARYAREDHAADVLPALVEAQAKLDSCGVEIALALRDRVHEREAAREAHAVQLRKVRHSLAEARRAVEMVHRMVDQARAARERAKEMREDDRLRKERVQDRRDRDG
jgi:hypothetical protein